MLKRVLKSVGQPVYRGTIGTKKINDYVKHLPENQELRVVFGGHWSNNPGWLLLTEYDQDVTKRLKFADNSVDVVFTEHVMEHVPFAAGINFMRESLRILKPGGVLRVVCPMLEPMLAFNPSDPQAKAYAEGNLVTNAREEQAALKALGLDDGVSAFSKTFLFNNLFRKHAHQFIWSAEQMRQVLLALGFRKTEIKKVGDSVNSQYAIERRHRGAYSGSDWKHDREISEPIYDPESGVVEAVK